MPLGLAGLALTHGVLCLAAFGAKARFREITFVAIHLVSGLAVASIVAFESLGTLSEIGQSFALSICCSVAIEELVYRWLLPRWLEVRNRNSTSRMMGVLLWIAPALSFGLSHLASKGPTIQLAVVAAAGLFLQVVTKTGGLWVAVLAHGVFNLRSAAALTPFGGKWLVILGAAWLSSAIIRRTVAANPLQGRLV
jgi:membrane protease YdiL (CAAX protease family)